MMDMNYLHTLLLAMSVPSAVTGFCFWLIQRKITRRQEQEDKAREKRQKYVDEKEARRDELQYLLIQSVNASIALSEATARAVQRIPDAHCNGDMESALNYATDIKHQQKEFLTKQGIKNIFDMD
jgi:hypothetical protein